MRKSPGWAIITLIALPLMGGMGFVLAKQGAPVEVFVAAPDTEEQAPAGVVAGETDEITEAPSKPAFVAPIAEASRRVTKKPFGIEIHPATSPVPNDHFDGFHVGVDFETFEDEQDVEIPIFAICEGPLRFKKYAQGYGGVAVQACRLDGEDISVIYGHLNIASVVPEAGDKLEPGQRIGALGKGYSAETDGVRKHLHLGIRKGLTSDIRGYVKNATETDEFIDSLSRMSF